MKGTLNGIFIPLFLLVLLVLIIGLITPNFLAKITKIKAINSRKKVGIWFGIATLVLFILVGVTAPLADTSKISTQTSVKRSPSNSPSPSPTSTIATNSPVPSPAKTSSGEGSATGVQYSNGSCHSIDGRPDPVCTPGAASPNVTQENIQSTICVSGYTTTIRPPTSYTNNLKIEQIKEYGYSDTNLSDYEEDHLIPLEVGGDPTNPKNLWPEPYNVSGNYGAYSKDKVENLLHSEVCSDQISLQQAQYEISSNWEAVSANTSVNTISTPQATTAPATTNQNGATALCNDGTYSYASSHQGACSHHGGVAQFYK